MKLKPIESFEEASLNAIEFNRLTPDSDSEAYRNFRGFYHWYYFPEHDIFGPSKFIGYSGVTLSNYTGGEAGHKTGGRHGRDSQRELKKLFQQLHPDSTEFQDLRVKLESFASSLKKDVNKKTFHGKGGIYVPKPDVSPVGDQEQQEAVSDAARKKAEREAILSRIVDEDDESATPEGKVQYGLHRYIERDGTITKKAKAKRLAETGKLECEACEFDFAKVYGELGEGFIEGHHTVPVANLDGTVKTKVSDIALLCSNCHRMIHRGSPLTVAELRDLVRRLRPSDGSKALNKPF